MNPVQELSSSDSVNGPVDFTESFGSPVGKEFSDASSVIPGQIVSSISIWANTRITGVNIQISAPQEQSLEHGEREGIPITLALTLGEYIVSMEAHWGIYNGVTLIYYVCFTTNLQATIQGGTKTKNRRTVLMPENYQLAGLFGHSDGDITQLGAIMTTAPMLAYLPNVPTTPMNTGSTQNNLPPASLSSQPGNSPSQLGNPPMTYNAPPTFAQPQYQLGGASNAGMTPTGRSSNFDLLVNPQTNTDGNRYIPQQVYANPILSNGRVTIPTPGVPPSTLPLPSKPVTSPLTEDGDPNASASGADDVDDPDLVAAGQKELSKDRSEPDDAASGKLKVDESSDTTDSPSKEKKEDTSEALDPKTLESPAPKLPPPPNQITKEYGGPHGNPFTDGDLSKPGQFVSEISLRAGERVNGIGLKISKPTPIDLVHGGNSGELKTMVFGADEYIKSMEIHWAKKAKHTRVFFIRFTSNTGNTLEGGTQTKDRIVLEAPPHFQLGGWTGKCGMEIDMVGAIWTSLPESLDKPELPEPETPSKSSDVEEPTPPTKSEDLPINQVSKTYGGPHGTGFTDEKDALPGQVVGSISIRCGRRVDGVVMDIVAPIKTTFRHGGEKGGELKTLTLSPGEYVVAMEIHWAKHDGHTRIFFLRFSTNKGNSIEGGEQKKDNAIERAPEGFQLGGWFGRQGAGLDQLAAVWTAIPKE
ncbi:hypothetical protein CCR75_005418 [Bremia lactucae]|uniref:Jacalin-type lectin domain-containing protein n=1 Tax=Bremia lactucae TaxID=4779 RepID=A0A976FJJ5_BRELC|nr:hypothetical protein CCR75_005418 [Bremia lactucae]